MYYSGTPDGGTEIQIPVPIVTLDLPIPNFRSVANAATKVSSGNPYIELTGCLSVSYIKDFSNR